MYIYCYYIKQIMQLLFKQYFIFLLKMNGYLTISGNYILEDWCALRNSALKLRRIALQRLKLRAIFPDLEKQSNKSERATDSSGLTYIPPFSRFGRIRRPRYPIHYIPQKRGCNEVCGIIVRWRGFSASGLVSYHSFITIAIKLIISMVAYFPQLRLYKVVFPSVLQVCRCMNV